MKVKALVAGVVLAMGASAANATLTLPVNDNGNFVLSAFDGVGKSLTLDLGVSQDAFLTNTAANGFNSNANWSISVDSATWGAFYSAANAGSTTFNVVAADGTDAKVASVGAAGQGQYGFIQTLSPAATAPTPGVGTTSGYTTEGNMINTINAYYTNINIGTTAASKVWVAGEAAFWPEAWLNNFFNTPGGLTNDGALGSQLAVWFNGVDATAGARGPTLKNTWAKLPGTFSLSANGTLTYSAVPVPGAIWLLGSALAGLVTIARRDSKRA